MVARTVCPKPQIRHLVSRQPAVNTSYGEYREHSLDFLAVYRDVSCHSQKIEPPAFRNPLAYLMRGSEVAKDHHSNSSIFLHFDNSCN